jgi:hypothetical protein
MSAASTLAQTSAEPQLAQQPLVDRPHFVDLDELDLGLRVPHARSEDRRRRAEGLEPRLAERPDLHRAEPDLVVLDRRNVESCGAGRGSASRIPAADLG